jgi:hypothetical protein
MKTKDEDLIAIDNTTLTTVKGAWGPALAAIAAGGAYVAYSTGHEHGIAMRGQGGKPSDSLRELATPFQAGLTALSPAAGIARGIYKFGEYVGRK